jgi:hypothetical protein
MGTTVCQRPLTSTAGDGDSYSLGYSAPSELGELLAHLGQNTDGEPHGHLRTVPGNGIREGVQQKIGRHWHAASTQLGDVDLPDLLTALPGTSGAGRVECLAERGPSFLPLALMPVPALSLLALELGEVWGHGVGLIELPGRLLGAGACALLLPDRSGDNPHPVGQRACRMAGAEAREY